MDSATVLLPMLPLAEEAIMMLENAGYALKKLESVEHDYLVNIVSDVDAILLRTGKLDREIIEHGKKLKIIAYHGAGVDGIDIEAATEHKIYVTRAPTANSVSVAEHTIALIFAYSKKIPFADTAVRKGKFLDRTKISGCELEGKTLAIAGLGNIGRRLANKALGLGMHVIGYDPYLSFDASFPGISVVTDWDKLFSDADFISLNLPLTDSTRGIVGKREFALMKNTAVLINTSRGPVVNEKELIEALETHEIGGACLDVYSQEPPLEDNPLFGLPNTVLTPHSASTTKEAMLKMGTQAAEEIIRVLSGKTPKWAVNSIC